MTWAPFVLSRWMARPSARVTARLHSELQARGLSLVAPAPGLEKLPFPLAARGDVRLHGRTVVIGYSNGSRYSSPRTNILVGLTSAAMAAPSFSFIGKPHQIFGMSLGIGTAVKTGDAELDEAFFLHVPGTDGHGRAAVGARVPISRAMRDLLVTRGTQLTFGTSANFVAINWNGWSLDAQHMETAMALVDCLLGPP